MGGDVKPFMDKEPRRWMANAFGPINTTAPRPHLGPFTQSLLTDFPWAWFLFGIIDPFSHRIGTTQQLLFLTTKKQRRHLPGTSIFLDHVDATGHFCAATETALESFQLVLISVSSPKVSNLTNISSCWPDFLSFQLLSLWLLKKTMNESRQVPWMLENNFIREEPRINGVKAKVSPSVPNQTTKEPCLGKGDSLLFYIRHASDRKRVVDWWKFQEFHEHDGNFAKLRSTLQPEWINQLKRKWVNCQMFPASLISQWNYFIPCFKHCLSHTRNRPTLFDMNPSIIENSLSVFAQHQIQRLNKSARVADNKALRWPVGVGPFLGWNQLMCFVRLHGFIFTCLASSITSCE